MNLSVLFIVILNKNRFILPAGTRQAIGFHCFSLYSQCQKVGSLLLKEKKGVRSYLKSIIFQSFLT